MEVLKSPGVQVLLWIGAVLAIVWMMGPSVMILLGRRRIGVDVTDDPREAEPRGGDPAYEKKFKRLVALGYRAVGKTVEHARFFSPMHWSWRSDGSRYLAGPDGRTFVSLHRIAGGDPLRTRATTIFDGGGVLVTSTPVISAHGRNVEVLFAGGNFRAEMVGDLEPAELLAEHAARVKEFSEDRRLSIKQATFREVAAEEVELDRRALRVMKAGFSPGWIFFGMAAGAAMNLPRAGRQALPIVPAAICAAAVLFAFMRWTFLPGRISQKVRRRVMMGMTLAITLAMIAVAFLLPDWKVARTLDRIDADVRNGRPAADVDSVVRRGPSACRPVVKALANPATHPETRRILHDILVKVRGADLGPELGAWEVWCAQARAARR